jgi:hypothetical protein
LADLKLELDDDFSELEGAVRVVGKVRVEKAKLKDRLLRAQTLLDQLLKIFANAVRCETGNSQRQYVQDCPDLWEAAARWVSTASFNHALITRLTALSRDMSCLRWTSRAKTNFGLRLTELLQRWMAIGMDSGLIIIHNAIINSCSI